MTKTQMTARIEVLKTKLNAFAPNAPLRLKVAVIKELRALETAVAN